VTASNPSVTPLQAASPCGCTQKPAGVACGGSVETSPHAPLLGRLGQPWTDGVHATALGDIPRARTKLGAGDRLGTLKIRCGFGRASYSVPPGLYAVGSPADRSPVLLSANYKLSFDALRAVLGGRDAWILVLDTKGINVWCAAGKGTFGTGEIIRRVEASGLARLVAHRRLIAPQLGAPGVAAHEVQLATGFRITWGPVRAGDLPAFLDARMKATPEMRRVRFDFRDRLLLVPVELVTGSRYALPAAAVVLLLGGLGSHGYAVASLATTGLASAALVLASFATAQVLGPILLPWLPGRAFAVKGATLGLGLAAALAASGIFGSWLHAAAWFALVPAITSFFVMNFTGATTYTSLSGVLREMRFAVPAQIAGGAVGLLLWLAGLFLPGGAAR
jgi:acetyl-CoA decarbonylase/synthase complex subunit gamma